MQALLISTYELGHQPLGLAQPLAHLHAAVIEARGLDLSVEPMDEVAVTQADFVGISTPMHTALRLGVQAAERVRALNPEAHVCFYGLYASLNADYLLRYHADSIIGGEVEEPLTAAVLAVAAGEKPDPIAISLGRQHFLRPQRHGLPPLDRYARLLIGGEARIACAVEASRGCAHQCLHCPIPPVYGGRLRVLPATVVLDDIRQTVGMGAEHITFADPDFFNGVRHSLAVARAMHDEFPGLTFDATIKVEHLLEHRELLPELASLGCLFITSAVESLSDHVLEVLVKGHTATDVTAALELARSAGIALRPTLLPFTPWTEMGDYLAMLDYVEQNGLVYALDPIQYAIRLLIPPGSSLLRSAAMQPHLRGLNETDFAHEWAHPDSLMDRLARDVAAFVAEAACDDGDVGEVFAGVRNLARHAAGMTSGHPWCPLASQGPRSPRLSESWFCCAEPTADQFAALVSQPAGV
jgi:radical SAM superfamily enzyme YgiQ (UPF0313 family)